MNIAEQGENYCFLITASSLATFNSVVDRIKPFFFANEEFYRFFAAKLCHFIINKFFLYVANTQA